MIRKTFSKLVKLDLGACYHLNDVGLNTLLRTAGHCLKHLNLERTNITGDSLYNLKSKFKMNYLNLTNCKQLSDSGLQNMLSVCGSFIKDLYLCGTNITGEGIATTKKQLSLQRLQNLRLDSCKQLTDFGLVQFLMITGKNIKVLKISNGNITGEGLVGLPNNSVPVEILDLAACRYLSDAGLCEVLRVFSHSLKNLNLMNTEITGKGMKEHAPKLSKLQRLNLQGCRNLYLLGLRELLHVAGRELKMLNLSGTSITNIHGSYVPNCDIFFSNTP